MPPRGEDSSQFAEIKGLPLPVQEEFLVKRAFAAGMALVGLLGKRPAGQVFRKLAERLES